MSFNQQLETLLKTLDKFTDKEGILLKQNIKHHAEQFDSELIKLLLNNKTTKAHFFDAIDEATIFNYRKFIDYIDDKNFLIDSYTKFANKVGLTISNKHMQQINEVVLSFPFKDCVLEGGQSKDDEKRKEIFFNEVLANDEINRLLDKKVITSAKKYTKDGASDEINFKRDENGLIKDNLIIKGNNLLALHTLKSNFAGKVKLIYIDPPYNTGNDSFNYNDNFNHSTWLTFMKNRLEVARDLLSDDGVIFVQCDDNEQAYLKVLMNEVFGREEFLSTIIVKSKTPSGVGQESYIFDILETIHLFSKNSKALSGNNYKIFDEVINKDSKTAKNYKYIIDNYGIDDETYSLTSGSGNNIKVVKLKDFKYKSQSKNKSTGQWFVENCNNIFRLSPANGGMMKKITPQLPREPCYIEYIPTKGKYKDKLTRFYFIKREMVVFVLESSELSKNKKTLNKMVNVHNNWTSDSLWQGIAKEGDVILKNGKKPEALLQRIIELSTKKGDLVLDYHLGSGTTCAVAHKMGRQYIGIEQMDYIEGIAVKRMQKIIGKKTKKDGELLERVDFDNGGISKSVDWQGGGEFIYFELDKYNQAFIEKIAKVNEKNILKLYDDIIEKAFLNYDVESEKLKDKKQDFKALNLSDKKEFLFSILNKNQLYKNLSEIDDKDLQVDENVKALNKGFYNE